MDKIKILVAQHKKWNVPYDNVYLPIHVGKALTEVDLKIQGDNTGDNISKLNPYFCELTALYWGWKNLDCEYIGLAHYRRYFSYIITENNIDDIMRNYDIILNNKLYLNNNILFWLSDNLIPDDIAIFDYYMKQKFPDTLNEYLNFFHKRNFFHPANMFIMKKEAFNEFAKWEFEILNDLFNIIPQSTYSREKRLMGYLSEVLLSYWVYIKKLRIKCLPCSEHPSTKDNLYKQPIITKLYLAIKYYKGLPNYHPMDAIMNGLKQDGILEKISEQIRQNK